MATSTRNEPGGPVSAQSSEPCYADPAAPGVAAVLLRSAELIKRFQKREHEAMLAIGSELIAVGELLDPDEFALWIAENVKGVTDEMMQACIAVATETMAADAADCNKPTKPKLVGWEPNREQPKQYGYADIQLPSGLTLHHCPVRGEAPDGLHVTMICASHFWWIGEQIQQGLDSDEFDPAIIAQIREVHPGAFEEDLSPAEARDSLIYGITGRGAPRK
jgi:hypothetical protein